MIVKNLYADTESVSSIAQKAKKKVSDNQNANVSELVDKIEEKPVEEIIKTVRRQTVSQTNTSSSRQTTNDIFTSPLNVKALIALAKSQNEKRIGKVRVEEIPSTVQVVQKQTKQPQEKDITWKDRLKYVAEGLVEYGKHGAIFGGYGSIRAFWNKARHAYDVDKDMRPEDAFVSSFMKGVGDSIVYAPDFFIALGRAGKGLITAENKKEYIIGGLSGITSSIIGGAKKVWENPYSVEAGSSAGYFWGNVTGGVILGKTFSEPLGKIKGSAVKKIKMNKWKQEAAQIADEVVNNNTQLDVLRLRNHQISVSPWMDELDDLLIKKGSKPLLEGEFSFEDLNFRHGYNPVTGKRGWFMKGKKPLQGPDRALKVGGFIDDSGRNYVIQTQFESAPEKLVKDVFVRGKGVQAIDDLIQRAENFKPPKPPTKVKIIRAMRSLPDTIDDTLEKIKIHSYKYTKRPRRGDVIRYALDNIDYDSGALKYTGNDVVLLSREGSNVADDIAKSVVNSSDDAAKKVIQQGSKQQSILLQKEKQIQNVLSGSLDTKGAFKQYIQLRKQFWGQAYDEALRQFISEAQKPITVPLVGGGVITKDKQKQTQVTNVSVQQIFDEDKQIRQTQKIKTIQDYKQEEDEKKRIKYVYVPGANSIIMNDVMTTFMFEQQQDQQQDEDYIQTYIEQQEQQEDQQQEQTYIQTTTPKQEQITDIINPKIPLGVLAGTGALMLPRGGGGSDSGRRVGHVGKHKSISLISDLMSGSVLSSSKKKKTKSKKSKKSSSKKKHSKKSKKKTKSKKSKK